MSYFTRRNLVSLFAALLLAPAFPASADLVYDNSINDLKIRFATAGIEVGDEIILAGNARFLTNFAFEWYGLNAQTPSAFQGTVEARVRFYENSGSLYNGYAQPSATPFYDSLWFGVPYTTERSTFHFTVENSMLPVGGLYLPVLSNMTWSVQFRGMQGSDVVGVDVYGPASVGLNYPDYWENTGSSWILKTNAIGPVNFAARFSASPVPEPSSLALSILGGLGLLAILSRRNR